MKAECMRLLTACAHMPQQINRCDLAVGRATTKQSYIQYKHLAISTGLVRGGRFTMSNGSVTQGRFPLIPGV